MEDSSIVLAGKLGIAIVCSAAMFLTIRHPRTFSLTNRQFSFVSLALLLISRMGLFIGLYLILGYEVKADVGHFYFQEGRAVLDGKTVYQDFETSYSPLFPYLIAGILLIWHSAKAIVLAAIVFEFLSLSVWLTVSRRWFDEKTTRIATLLYVTSPIPLLNVGMNGQNQIWVAFLLVISLWLLSRRDTVSGFVQGFSLIAIKALSLLFVPVIWLFAASRFRWLAAFAMLPAFTLLIASYNEINLFFPLQFQAKHFTGGNLPYLTTIFGIDPTVEPARYIYDTITILALMAVFLRAWSQGVHRDPRNVIHLMTLVMLTFFLTSKKAYTSYLVMSFFVFCISLASHSQGWRALFTFATFGILASLEPSLHFRWMFSGGEKQYLSVLFQETLPEGMVRWKACAFLLWDIALVACYVWYFRLTWRKLLGKHRSDSSE